MARWLADALRAAGLRVEEVAGWQDRGHGELRNDTQNMVVVDHHTAGGPNGRAPSLATCLYGVPGVPGPLCNVLQTREADGNDAFIVIAAGNSYNAGTGGFAGVSGNFSTIGLEVEHTGVIPYPNNRAEYTHRFNAAVLQALGQGDGSRNCQHFEWSNAGKIDIGTPKVDANWFRQRTTEFMQSGGDFFTMGQMDDLAQWEKDTRKIILEQLIGTYEQGKYPGILAQWEKDTRKIVIDEVTKQVKASEERIIAAINAR